MNGTTQKIVAVAIVVILLATGVSVFFIANNNNSSAETRDYDYDMTITKVGGHYKMIDILMSEDVFTGECSAEDFTVYFAPLDSYVSDGTFDSDRYYDDLSEKGTEDEKSGEMLPEGYVKITEYKDLLIDETYHMSFYFENSDSYGLYGICCTGDMVADGFNKIVAFKYDVPASSQAAEEAYIFSSNTVYQNEENPDIEIQIANGKFKSAVAAESVSLLEGFQGLTVVSANVEDSGAGERSILKISTTGKVDNMVVSGGVSLSADATEGEVELFASVDLEPNFFIIDTASLDYSSTYKEAIFDAYFSENFSGVSKVTIGTTECDIDAISYLELLNCYCGKVILTGVDDPDAKFTELYGADIKVDGSIVSNLYIDAVSVISDVTDIKESGDSYVLDIILTPILGIFNNNITADNFEVDNGEILQATSSLGIAYLKVSLDGQGDDSSGHLTIFEGITIKNAMKSAWGTDVATAYSGIYYTDYDDPEETLAMIFGAEPSVDDMVKALYSKMKTGDIFKGIESGIELIGAILQMTGVLEVPDPHLAAISEVQFTCDEIKNMLVLQSEKLNKISNQISILSQKVDDIRIKQLAGIYSKYTTAVNKIISDSETFGSLIKKGVYDDIVMSSANSFYLYFCEDQGNIKMTLMPGTDYYVQQFTGKSLDNKDVDFEMTVEISIDSDTFANTRNLSNKFIDGKYTDPKTTPYNMILDLKTYFEENDISVEGFTQDELAKKAYEMILYKFTQITSKGDYGTRLIEDYKSYITTMASLTGIVPDPNIPNPVKSIIQIVESRCNFYPEAAQELKVINNSFAVITYETTMFAAIISELSGGDSINDYYEAGIKFLKDNTGAKEVYNDKVYCYASASYVAGKDVFIKTTGTFKCKNSDWYDHVYGSISNDRIESTVITVKKYVNELQLNQIYKNYLKMGIKENFLTYLKNMTGLTKKFIITDYKDINGRYGQGDGVVLMTWDKKILSGHSSSSKWVLQPNKMIALNNHPTHSSKFACEFSDVHGNHGVRGTVFDATTGRNVGIGADGFIFTVGYLASHHSGWSYDEAQFATPRHLFGNDCSIDSNKSGKSYTLSFTAWYSMLGIV